MRRTTRGKKYFRLEPSYLPDCRQHFLKALSGAAWTQISSAQFLEKMFSACMTRRPRFTLVSEGSLCGAYWSARKEEVSIRLSVAMAGILELI